MAILNFSKNDLLQLLGLLEAELEARELVITSLKVGYSSNVQQISNIGEIENCLQHSMPILAL